MYMIEVDIVCEECMCVCKTSIMRDPWAHIDLVLKRKEMVN